MESYQHGIALSQSGKAFIRTRRIAFLLLLCGHLQLFLTALMRFRVDKCCELTP